MANTDTYTPKYSCAVVRGTLIPSLDTICICVTLCPCFCLVFDLNSISNLSFLLAPVPKAPLSIPGEAIAVKITVYKEQEGTQCEEIRHS